MIGHAGFACLAMMLGAWVSGAAETGLPPALVPWPKTVSAGQGRMELKAGRLVAQDASLAPLAHIVSDEIFFVSGIRLKPDGGQVGAGDIGLQVDRQMKDEQYSLAVTDRVMVRGGSYRAVAWGTATLLQAISASGKEPAGLPQMRVADEPAAEYRGLLIDCARQWHPAQSLKDVIVMCRLYKVNYIHLHLTDNESFTFPSKAFPSLPSVAGKNGRRHYTWEELVDVVTFADERGVTLIPELETPGHSGKLKQVEPFGRPGLSCVNMASEKAYEAFDTLIGEMCEVFKSSPYFHIGTDEATLTGSGEQPEEKAYMKTHGLETVRDLFNHHIVRLDQIVKKHGKKTMRWGGFSDGGSGAAKLPADIVTMVWEVRGGGPGGKIDHPIINAAWKPLYVVGNKAWLPEYLLEKWNVRLWQFHLSGSAGVQLPPGQPVMGAQMCAWEQSVDSEIPSLRWRLPAMCERVCNPDSGRPYADYARRFERTDALLDTLFCPVRADYEGLVGDLNDRVFTNALVIKLSARTPGTIRYTLDGSEPTASSPPYAGPVTVRVGDVKPEDYLYSRARGRNMRTSQRLHLKVACYGADGKPLGQSREDILYATRPLVRAKIYYSPKMFDNTKEDWKAAKDWEKMGIKPDKEVIWPSLVFSMDSGVRGAVFVPLCSGVASAGKIKVPQDAKYAFLYGDSGGEVTVDGKLVTKSSEALLQAVDLKAGVHAIEVRYAHPNAFHYGGQSLLYAVLKDGQAVGELLDPPKKDEIWNRPKKGMWHSHEELLVPFDVPGQAGSAGK